MFHVLDLHDPDTRQTLNVFRALFGLRFVRIGRWAFVWSQPWKSIHQHYGPVPPELRAFHQ